MALGTGGETLGGNLYLTTLSQIMTGSPLKAKLLDSSPSKGYIGPAIWADITQDGNPNIFANAVEGKLFAYDEANQRQLWSTKMPETEAYSSVAPGYMDNDGQDEAILNVNTTSAHGKWSCLEKAFREAIFLQRHG